MRMATIRRKKPESFAILSSPGPWPQVLINWLATLAVIIVFGLIMLFSASYTTGYLRMGDSFYYIKSQMLCLGLGLAVMLLFSRIEEELGSAAQYPGFGAFNIKK
jgi:cell division protein FtsW